VVFVNIANSGGNSYRVRKEMKERSKESKEIYKSQRRKKKKGKTWAVRGCLRGVAVGAVVGGSLRWYRVGSGAGFAFML
jgi:hypothetical protein